MKEIILVGTLHIDTKGPERLQKILEKENPDIVSIVCSKESLFKSIKRQEYINKNKLTLKHSTRRIKFTPFTQSEIPKLNKETLMKFFSIISFELIIAKKYTEENNKKLIFTDKKEYEEGYFKNFSNNPNKNIIHHFKMLKRKTFELPPEYFQKVIDQLYKNNQPKKIEEKDSLFLLRRNKYAVNKILETKAKKIIHIVGMAHIFNNSPNMYEMLKQKGQNVKRLKLIDADNI